MSNLARLPQRTSSSDLRAQLAEAEAAFKAACASLAAGKVTPAHVAALRDKRDELAHHIIGEEQLEAADAERRAAAERVALEKELVEISEAHGPPQWQAACDGFVATTLPFEDALARQLDGMIKRANAGVLARARAEQIAQKLGVAMPDIPHFDHRGFVGAVRRAVYAQQVTAGRNHAHAEQLPLLVSPLRIDG